jgi:hypothetical protein
MEKSKIWIKDRLSISDYQVGQKVRVVRRKKNGYPNAMIDGESYLIREIKYDSLVLISLDGDDWFCTKVHWTYCSNLKIIRDEIINDILKD